MKELKRRNFLFMGIVGLYLLSLLTACTTTKSQTGWTDLPHARKLDSHKGNKSKKVMKRERVHASVHKH